MTDTKLVTYLVLHDYLLLVKRTWLFASIGTYGDDYIPPIYKYMLRRRHHSATWYYYGDATIPPLLDVHYGDDKIPPCTIDFATIKTPVSSTGGRTAPSAAEQKPLLQQSRIRQQQPRTRMPLIQQQPLSLIQQQPLTHMPQPLIR